MIKKTLLISLTVIGFVFRASAETVFQQMGRAQDTMAEVAIATEERARRAEAQAYADRLAQAQAQIAAEQQARAQQRAADEKRAREQFDVNSLAMNARVRWEYSNPLVKMLPSSDSDSAIRDYLATKGYKSVSGDDLAKIRFLMFQYNIRHINEIGL
jgi:hypothetical protein